MSEITDLAGVLVYTTSERFPAMRSFYVDTLGLSPRSDRPGFVNFEWGGRRLTVSVHSEVEGTARDPLRIMVNLAVRDAGAAVDRVRAAGLPVLRPPEPEPWGGTVATVSDPDGNLVQFLEL